MTDRFKLHALALAFVFLAFPIGSLSTADIPRTNQLLIAIADDWNSRTAGLYAFQLTPEGWIPTRTVPISVLLGRSGLAWGRGLLPHPPGTEKRERDGRSPAGYFKIGRIFGYAGSLPAGSDPEFAYRRVTKWDAWPDDVRNPFYNQHIVINPQNIPPWHESARMRLGDDAYKWLVEIRHNADPQPVPGAGSAIFFHTRRGPNRYTSGCTAMKLSDLESIIRWLRWRSVPHYVLLPREEYERLKGPWQLPQIP